MDTDHVLISNSYSIRILCVDAIVDAGDANSDWRLDFEEYKALLDSSFEPKEKRKTSEDFFLTFLCLVEYLMSHSSLVVLSNLRYRLFMQI